MSTILSEQICQDQGSPVAFSSASASASSSSCSEPSAAATLGNLPHEVRL